MPIPYRLSTAEVQDGYAVVNGKPHGFTWAKQFEVTFHFDTLEERAAFIRDIKKPLESDDASG